MYIFRGILFGFRIIDDDCDISYDTRVHRIADRWERTIIEDRLNAELESGILTRPESAPTCVHGIFVVIKDGGGGRSIIDCSKPRGGER